MNKFFEDLISYFNNFFDSNNQVEKPKKKRGRPSKYFKDIEIGFNPELSYLINKKLNLIEDYYNYKIV